MKIQDVIKILEKRCSELLEYTIWLEGCDADQNKKRFVDNTYETNLALLRIFKGERN